MEKRALWHNFPVLIAVAVWMSASSLPAAADQKMEGGGGSKYIGAGSCSATACHGGVQPRTITRILQNEYSIWAVQDPHAKAYRSLENSVSQRMGKILGIGDPTKAQKCLVCHALDVPPEKRGREFDISDGVSCESCHGPASAWLGPHTQKDWPHEKNLALGMTDQRGLDSRAERCLDCHLGNAKQQVDHEMIGAGHPDLVFELDSYTAIMPPHWKLPEDPNFGLRDWSVGQAVDLRETLKRLERHARSGQWPEYADMDCFACHHSLTKPENSWRQERGYAGRQAGAPPFNTAHYAVFRLLARELDSRAADELETAMDAVYKNVGRYSTPSKEVADNAARAGRIAEDLVGKVNSARFDRSMTARLLAAVAANGNKLADEDTRTAEQAAMTLDSLYISYSKQGGQQPGVRSAIDGLFKLLDNPSAYNAPQFRAQMERVNAALRDAGIH